MRQLLAVALTLALAACASTSNTSNSGSTAQKPMEEKEYRIGSRIPVKDPVSSSPTGSASPSAMGTGAPTRTN